MLAALVAGTTSKPCRKWLRLVGNRQKKIRNLKGNAMPSCSAAVLASVFLAILGVGALAQTPPTLPPGS
jgi:hypothetical protein